MSNTATSRSAIKLTVIALVMLLVLAALGVSYYFLTRPIQVNEVSQKNRNYMFSIYGFEGDLLRRPSSVAVGPNGDIYVADTGKKRIVVFDRDGNFITTYGEFGDKPLQLWEPLGVAVAPDGRSYVLDKSKKKIVMYDASRKAVKAITTPEYPLSVRVANGNLFVTLESGIVISDLDGKMLTGYVKRGKKPGEFDRPGAVAVDKEGNLYVADSLNYRIQAISTKGKPLWQYGTPLDPKKLMDMTQNTGQKFGVPASLAMDENGYIYVVDGLNSEIVVLDKDGEFVEKMGDVGHDDGKFYYPDGIDYADGRLVIADKYNDRVEVFSVPTASAAADFMPYVPWLIPLLLLPLLFLVFRRKPAYIMTPEFLGVMETAEDGSLVAKVVKKVSSSPTLAEIGADMKDLPLDWKAVDVTDEDVEMLVERYGLTSENAAALAIAIRLKGKRTLLAEDPAITAAASELAIPAITFEEMVAPLRDKTAEAEETA